MDRCPVCNGRTMMSEQGVKCMNANCKGATLEEQGEGVFCLKCDQKMSYQGEDSWGQPTYLCLACRATRKT